MNGAERLQVLVRQSLDILDIRKLAIRMPILFGAYTEEQPSFIKKFFNCQALTPQEPFPGKHALFYPWPESRTNVAAQLPKGRMLHQFAIQSGLLPNKQLSKAPCL
jgi:hypothetical protein